MSKLLSQLWNGNLSPISTCGVDNKEMSHLVELMEKNSDRLQQTLTEEQKKIFDAFVDCHSEYQMLLAETAFAQGFSLAVQLLGEAEGQTFSLT